MTSDATRAPRRGGSSAGRGGRRDRREDLVAAAVDLGRRSGLGSIEAAAVAVKAGVSKALVYYYFPTHADLQTAVVQDAADELMAAIEDAVPVGAEPGEMLTAGLDAAILFIEQQPEALVALARSAGFHPKTFEVFESARDRVADLIANRIGLTELTAGQRIALRAWVALTEEAVLHWAGEGRQVPRPELVTFCRESALHVLASPLAGVFPPD